MGHAFETSVTFSEVLTCLLAIVIIVSLFFNLTFGYALLREKSHHIDHTRCVMLNIVACDLLQTVLAFILELFNLHVSDIFWYKTLCHSSHFIVFSFTGVIMMLLATLSSLRCLALNWPQTYQYYFIDKNNYFYASIFMCYLIGLSFPSVAFIKWSKYPLLASNNKVCVLEWEKQRLQTAEYFLCIFLFLYILTGITVISTLNQTSKEINRITTNENDNYTEDVDFFQLLFYKICLTFYFCWIPYILCGFLSFVHLTPYSVMFSVSKLFAKLSTVAVPAAGCIERPYKEMVKANCFCWKEDYGNREIAKHVKEYHMNSITVVL